MVTLVNRAKMTTATTGTGTITLGSAVDGYQTYAAAGVVDADVVRYVIEDGNDWEIGTGTYSSTGPTQTRTLVESSTGSLLNLSGDAVVYITAAGEDIQQPPSEGPFVDGDKTKLDGIEAGATADQTAGEIKTAYESNANTNAFTDAEQTKLAGIEATADVTDAGNVNPLVDAHLNTSSATSGEYLSWTGSDYDWVAVSGYTDADVDTHLNTGTAASGEVLSWNGSDYDWITSGGAFSVIGTNNLAAIATLPALTTGINNFAAGPNVGDSLTSGYSNVAIGNAALDLATSGHNNVAIGERSSDSVTTASYNVAIGSQTMRGVTTSGGNTIIGAQAGIFVAGLRNTALGHYALYGSLASNLTGSYNVGIGYQTGYDLSTGTYNFLGGYQAGTNLTTGSRNVAIGNNALDAATTGSNNVAIGQDAAGGATVTTTHSVFLGTSSGLYSNAGGSIGIGRLALRGDAVSTMTGLYNIGIGGDTGSTLTTGLLNSLVGYRAGQNLTTGSRNVAIGSNAGDLLTTGGNNIVLGNGSDPSSATVSNEITLGNSSITTLRCQVTTITSLSDARDKADIQPLNAGLEFVEALNPVSFTWNMRDGGKVGVADTGFIAQDLQKAQSDLGLTIPDLVYDVNPDKLEAGYGKLIPVLVQAVKDLSDKVKDLEAKLEVK